MTASAQINSLGKADMISDFNRRQIIQPRFLTNPDMIPDRQLPGVLDPDMGLDHSPFPNPGTKQPEQDPFGTAEWQQTGFKEQQAAGVPDDPDYCGSSR